MAQSSRVPWPVIWAKDWFKAKQETMVFRCFLTLQTALSYLWAYRCQALLPEKQCRTPWFLFSEKRELHRRGVPSPIHVHLVPTRQVSLAPIAASHYFLLTWRFEVALLEPQENLVGGWPTPLKNMSSSVGMMTFPKYGKIKFMFQTTNQKLNSYWQTVGVDLTALGPELLVRLERCF